MLYPVTVLKIQIKRWKKCIRDVKLSETNVVRSTREVWHDNAAVTERFLERDADKLLISEVDIDGSTTKMTAGRPSQSHQSTHNIDLIHFSVV